MKTDVLYLCWSQREKAAEAMRLNCILDTNTYWFEWTYKNYEGAKNELKLSKTMVTRFTNHVRAGKVHCCTQPDINGNFFMVDLDLLKHTIERGYCYRLACRADDVVASKAQLSMLADWAESIGFKKI